MRKLLRISTITALVLMLSCWTLSFSIQRPIMIIAVLLYLIELITSGRMREWKWSSEKWVYVAFVAYFLVTPLFAVLRQEDLSNKVFTWAMECRYPLLLFSLMGLCGWPEGLKLRHFCYGMIVVPVLAIAWILVYHYDFDVDSISEAISNFNYSRKEYFLHHMSANIGFNMALIAGYHVIRDCDIKRWIKILAGVLTVPSLLALFVTEGRIGFATMILLLMVFVVREVWKKNKKLVYVTVPVLIMLGAVAFVCHPRVNKDLIMHSTRFKIWAVGTETIKESPLTGLGTVNGKIEFVERGVVEEPELFDTLLSPLPEGHRYLLHPHNIILDEWLANGVLGVVLLIVFLTIPLFFAENKFYLALFETVFVIQWMFDVFTIVRPMALIMLMALFVSRKKFV